VQKIRRIGIKSVNKLKKIFKSMEKSMVKIQECNSLKKYLAMLIKINEGPCGKVSKQVEERFYQLIGMMCLKKTIKEKIDLPLQKASNGKRENYD
jgi:choline kinase